MSQIQAAIFDWAGTMVDFGSRAPMGVFVEAFSKFQVPVTIEQARGPMGLPKRAHIASMLAEPAIAAAWARARGAAPTEADIDAVYDVFLPLNEAVAADYADLVPGALDTVAALKARGIRIGSTTGYTRSIIERILPVAKRQGYAPETVVCAGDLPAGRPTALMMFKCFVDLDVEAPWRAVKVDDTEPGIAEGIAAGAWTVGLSLSGNEVGFGPEELAAAPVAEVERRKAAAVAKLEGAGAHYVIDTVADLMPVIDDIEARIARGEKAWR